MAQANEEGVHLPPWPSEWNTPGGMRPLAVVVVSGSLGVAAGILGLVRAATSFSGGTITLLAGAIFALALSSGTALLRFGVRRRGVAAVHASKSSDGAATVVPNSRRVWVAVVAALSAGLVAFGFVALISWGFVLFAGETSAPMIFQALVSTAFVAGIVWFLWSVRRTSPPQGSLRLTSTGVIYKSLGPEESASWEDVLDVFPSSGGSPDIVLGINPNRTTARSTKKGGIVKVLGPFLSVDPALAYHALHYYLHHPESRSELGNSSSVARIQQGNFTE